MPNRFSGGAGDGTVIIIIVFFNNLHQNQNRSNNHRQFFIIIITIITITIIILGQRCCREADGGGTMVAGKPLRRWLRTVLHPPVFRTVLHHRWSRQKAGSDENSSLRPVCPDGLPKLRKLTSHKKTSPHAIFSPSEPPNPNSKMVCVKLLSLSQKEERASENEV